MTVIPLNLRSLNCDIKYIENSDRYDDGVNESRLGNCPYHAQLIGIMIFDLKPF